jgi:hypothetical protein
MSIYGQLLVNLRLDALEARMKEYASQVETLKEANAALNARIEYLETKSKEECAVSEPPVESQPPIEPPTPVEAKKPRGRPRKHA